MISGSQLANEIPFKPGKAPVSLLGNIISGVKSEVLKLLCAWKATRDFHAARAELLALDPHLLKDIGMDRSEIGSVLLDRAHERRISCRLHQEPYF